MADRPGSLATLARSCGEQDVNILGVQIFPGVRGVTDELVLRTPDGWGVAQVVALVAAAGGTDVTACACTEHALVDGPIQYLHALRRVAHDPATLATMLARLLDADEPAAPGHDTLAVDVGDQQVLLRRSEPFTATEHARAIAFAEVAAALVGQESTEASYDPTTGPKPTPTSIDQPVVRLAGFEDTTALRRMHLRCSEDSVRSRYGSRPTEIDDRFARRLLVSGGGALVASVEDEVVGVASLTTCEAGVVEVALLVEDTWQRRGLGTRLLSSAARLARSDGANEVVLRSRTHDPALMSLAFASGLRARIRLERDMVVVTVGVEGLKPLAAVPGPQPVPTRG